MEQVHYHWAEEEEEEEQQQLQHGKDNIIATALQPSFSSAPTNNAVSSPSASVGEQPLLQNEQVQVPHTHKVEETSNVAEHAYHFNDDSEAVGLGIVAEFVENVAASQNEISVYFDKQQGNDVDGARSVLPKSLGEGDLDIRVENSDIQCSPCNEVNSNHHMESELLPSHNASEIQAATVDNCGDETQEINQILKELDVEAVLAKQETHDLFCPNCKSCITKRVILRKRKRNIPNLDTKAKRDKSTTEVVNGAIDEANQGDHSIATPVDNYEPEREPDVFRCLACFSFFIPMRNGIKLFPSFGGTREPETAQKPSVIPSTNVENPSMIAASNANWFFALFTLNKGRKASAQGDATIEDSRTDPASIEDSRIGNPESPLANTSISQNVNLAPDIKLGRGGVNSPIPSIVKSVVKIESWIEKGKNSNVALQNEPLVDQNDVMNGLQKVGGNFSATEQLQTENVGDKKRDSVDVIKTDIVADISKVESVLLATVATTEILFNAGKPAKDVTLKAYEGSPIFEKSQKDVEKTLEIAQDSYSSLMEEAQSPDQSYGSAVVANDVASDKQSSRVDATIPSIQDFKKVQKDIEEEIDPSVAKGKKEALKTLTSQTVDDVPIEGAIVTETHTEIYIGEEPRAEIGEHQEWQILKSIVYGGLVESIASLGVVSSAAASDAAPLSIIALGLANLIGGLFVIGHNLIDLKNENRGGDSLQMNVQDRYEEVLGRRANFLLHAIVAVLSFLIFGSIPLVVYGLLISKNYYAEVKIAAVTATSVACIILLAIGKVYTTRPPKSYAKTVLHYVTLALATSGISYIAGDLVKDLLDKLSGSESGYFLTMPMSGTTRMKPAWTSY